MCQNLLNILLKHISGLTSLGWGLRVCIYNKFPGDDDVVGLGTAL